MFFSLFYMINSNVYGIDIGSEFLRVVSYDKSGLYKILTNYDGNQFFSTKLTIVNKSDDVDFIDVEDIPHFDFHKNSHFQERKHHDKTIKYWKLFSSKDYNAYFIDFIREKKIYNKLNHIENNRVTVQGILPEVSFQLSMYDVLDKVKSKTDLFVFSVPKYYLQSQRDSLRVVLDFLEVNSLIVDTTRTVSLTYFNENYIKIEQNKELNILFLDIGHLHLEFFLTKFTKDNGRNKIEELEYSYSDTDGAIDIDLSILEILKKKYGEDVNERIEFIFLEEAEIIKKKLSLFDEYHGTIEIDKGKTFSYNISAKEIEDGSLEFIESITNLTHNFKKYRIHQIHIIGSTFRLPFVKKLISSLFPRIAISSKYSVEDFMAKSSASYGLYKMNKIGKPVEYKHLSLYKYYVRNQLEVYDFNGTFPRVNENWWVYQRGEDMPFCVSPFFIVINATNRTTVSYSDELGYRLETNNTSTIAKWKYHIISTALTINEDCKEKNRINKKIDELNRVISEIESIVSLNNISVYAEEEEVSYLSKLLVSTREWINNNMLNLKYDHVEEKINFIKNLASNLMERYQNDVFLSSSVINLENRIKFILNDITNQNKLSESNKLYLLKVIAHIKLYIEEYSMIRYNRENRNENHLLWYNVEKISSDLLDLYSFLTDQ